MTDEKSKFDTMVATIEQMRDEIKLKAHLGKLEAAEELEKMDRKWHAFLDQYKPVSEEAGKAAEGAGTALKLAAEELKEGYERIRKLL